MSTMTNMHPGAHAKLLPIGPPPVPAATGFAKLAGGVGGFLKTTGGGMLMAGALQGYGQGKLAEEALDEKHRIENMWSDPEQMKALLEASKRTPEVPDKWGQGAAMAPWKIRNASGYAPTVNYA